MKNGVKILLLAASFLPACLSAQSEIAEFDSMIPQIEHNYTATEKKEIKDWIEIELDPISEDKKRELDEYEAVLKEVHGRYEVKIKESGWAEIKALPLDSLPQPPESGLASSPSEKAAAPPDSSQKSSHSKSILRSPSHVSSRSSTAIGEQTGMSRRNDYHSTRAGYTRRTSGAKTSASSDDHPSSTDDDPDPLHHVRTLRSSSLSSSESLTEQLRHHSSTHFVRITAGTAHHLPSGERACS